MLDSLESLSLRTLADADLGSSHFVLGVQAETDVEIFTSTPSDLRGDL